MIRAPEPGPPRPGVRSTSPGRRSRRCACAALAFGLAAFGGVADAALDATSDALSRLAASLAGESVGVQADFASVALAEVILAYEREFERLSAPGQVSRRELAKQSRWARAVEGFLEELYAARDELDAGAPVRVLVAPPSEVQLLVGERMVSLGSPRIETPGTLDQDIVTLFCDTFPCDPEVLDPPPREQVAQAPVGGWSFRAGMGSTFETADGLGFMFADVRGRAAKEAVCRRLHAELNRLAQALADARHQGRPVDFAVLAVESVGRGDDQRVVVSSAGARLRLSLPTLARVPAVVEVARDWLEARAQGRPHRQLFPRSELLLAGLLPGS